MRQPLPLHALPTTPEFHRSAFPSTGRLALYLSDPGRRGIIQSRQASGYALENSLLSDEGKIFAMEGHLYCQPTEWNWKYNILRQPETRKLNLYQFCHRETNWKSVSISKRATRKWQLLCRRDGGLGGFVDLILSDVGAEGWTWTIHERYNIQRGLSFK